jgi:hypothetical protein
MSLNQRAYKQRGFPLEITAETETFYGLDLGMSDSRLEERKRKRLSVRFGNGKLEHLGYSSDISLQGFFVESRVVYKSGAVMNFEIKTRDGELITMIGKIQWAKKAAPRLNHILKSGMGISIQKFLTGEEIYLALVSE